MKILRISVCLLPLVSALGFANDSGSSSLVDRLERNMKQKSEASPQKTGLLTDTALVLKGTATIGASNQLTKNVDRANKIIGASESVLDLRKLHLIEQIQLHYSKSVSLVDELFQTLRAIDPANLAQHEEIIRELKVDGNAEYTEIVRRVKSAKTASELIEMIEFYETSAFQIKDTSLTTLQRMKNAPAARRQIDRFNELHQEFRRTNILSRWHPHEHAILELADVTKNTAQEGKRVGWSQGVDAVKAAKWLRRIGSGLVIVGAADLSLRGYELLTVEDTAKLHHFPLIGLPMDLILGETNAEEHARAEMQVKPVVHSPMLSPQELRASSGAK